MRRESLPGLVFVLVLVTSTAYSQTAEKQTAQPPDSTQKKAEPQPHDTQVIEPPPYRSPDEKKPDLKAVAKSIIEQTNAFRESEKRPRVVENAKLMETARYFAGYMARTDRYGHRADESDPGERATKHGYEYGLISENIAYAFGSDGFTTEAISKQLVEGWEKSPGHRKNMLDPDVTEIGVAIAQSEKTGYYYAVQMFGRPKADAVRFEITNQSASTVSYKVADQAFTLEPRYTRVHEQGRPADLVFELSAGGKSVSKTVKGKNKARFILVDQDGSVTLKQE